MSSSTKIPSIDGKQARCQATQSTRKSVMVARSRCIALGIRPERREELGGAHQERRDVERPPGDRKADRVPGTPRSAARRCWSRLMTKGRRPSLRGSGFCRRSTSAAPCRTFSGERKLVLLPDRHGAECRGLRAHAVFGPEARQEHRVPGTPRWPAGCPRGRCDRRCSSRGWSARPSWAATGCR